MGELKIGRMCMGPVQTNCYFVYDDEAKKAVVFDAPCDGEGIYNGLKGKGIEVAGVCLTHGHFDHIMGANELRQAASVKVYALDDEQDVCENTHNNCSDQIGRLYTVKCNRYLKDNEEVNIEGIKFKVIATPGHTKGSCCYYFEDAGLLISGDTLFCCSIGRSDLPTGSEATLIRSLKERLMCLPDDVKVYPGHGDQTTIGFERKNNPFVY
ncbi:MAG: MBL fold metallo-hydrolase [Lachnospiraceae bacterium]|nr:MBL fold metallo-hydrolase [Lachnospiraceae bacterium]